ncbi:hypothetical protein GM418_26265 [Maribellus comscasis]|uniref:Uncharacterized protein n=1 Tax=Maribellus comscasis TaxID=2681766 RepID=A0A6I6K0C7_9BACT|nr:hypothetical protein [Maribellus comscasis]QGY47039.1 hypothetical protein GM418_26265 [Maribellus comscasis]
MAFSVKYLPLFKMNLLHHYFLNKGTDDYNSMTDTQQSNQLELYDVNSVLSIQPDVKTLQKINGYNLVFKKYKTGFSLWSKVTGENEDEPFIALEDDLAFTFLLKTKDSGFYNYTDLKIENAGKLYYLSNRRLETEPNSFPLIDKAGGNFHVDEDFILSEDGFENEMEKLKDSEKMNLMGLIRIFVKADNNALDITNAQGRIPEPSQNFEINIKNRETIWRYIFDTNQTVTGGDALKKENGNSKVLITKAEHPLTLNGFISIELGGVELPNPGVRAVKPDIPNNKYYSEIYM